MSATVPIDAAARAADAGPSFDPARIEQVHRAIRADPTIQFDLPMKVEERNPPPKWLESLFDALGSFVRWVGDGWTVLLWVAIAVLVTLLVLALFPGIRAWFADRFARGSAQVEPAEWAPTAAGARALLEEADALAQAGDYGAAVHLVLFRSIEDIRAWRGDIVRPALTSRDIAAADALPASARGVFASIVQAVERSLFGGDRLGEQDWRRARDDYAQFALRRDARAA